MDVTKASNKGNEMGISRKNETDAPQESEAPAVELAAFELTPEQEAVLHPRKGKVAEPSKYLTEAKHAVETGKTLGIKVPEGTKGSAIVRELNKAAKELGVKFKIQNREDKGGFVAFTHVKMPVAVESTETTSIPVVETPAA